MRRRPPAQPEGRRTLVPRLAVWVGLLCLFAQFSSAFHMLLVAHVRCAEHGEYVHAGADHHEARGPTAAEERPDAPAVSSSDSDDEHGHEHCLLCFERRNVVPRPAGAVQVRAAGRDGDVALLEHEASGPSTRIYAFAPKASPPV